MMNNEKIDKQCYSEILSLWANNTKMEKAWNPIKKSSLTRTPISDLEIHNLRKIYCWIQTTDSSASLVDLIHNKHKLY